MSFEKNPVATTIMVLAALAGLAFCLYVVYLVAEILKNQFFDEAESKTGNAVQWGLCLVLAIPLAIVLLFVVKGCNPY